jgi:hypothetical protein
MPYSSSSRSQYEVFVHSGRGQAESRSGTAVWQQTAGRQMQSAGCYFEALCQLRGLETDSLLRRAKFNQADYIRTYTDVIS